MSVALQMELDFVCPCLLLAGSFLCLFKLYSLPCSVHAAPSHLSGFLDRYKEFSIPVCDRSVNHMNFEGLRARSSIPDAGNKDFLM